jgi:hypothetical protein
MNLQFVSIPCDTCGSHQLCPIGFKENLGAVIPIVQLPVDKCVLCEATFAPTVFSLQIPKKHIMPPEPTEERRIILK